MENCVDCKGCGLHVVLRDDQSIVHEEPPCEWFARLIEGSGLARNWYTDKLMALDQLGLPRPKKLVRPER